MQPLRRTRTQRNREQVVQASRLPQDPLHRAHVHVAELPDERLQRPVQVAAGRLVRGDEPGLERAPALQHPPHPQEEHGHVRPDVEAVDEPGEQRGRPTDVERPDEGRR